MPLKIPPDLELKTIRSLVDFSGQRVLEIGAGDGRLAWPFASEAALWIALDPDQAEIALARKGPAADAERGRMMLVVGDGRALSFPGGYFDVAFFTWSLCCIPHRDKLAAVMEARRGLRPGGLLLDIHATDEPPRLEVWHARYRTPAASPERPDVLEAVQRVPVGWLDNDGVRHDFAGATDVLAEALEHGYALEHSTTFDYGYFFDTLDELTDYLEDDHEHASASDELLERALAAMQQATTTPKIVVLQRTVVTALRKN
jgi:SAM-dependent methyltransferase